MDLESTIETVASYVPDTVQFAGILDDAASYLPTDLDFGDIAQFLLFFTMGSLVFSILGRMVLGKRSSLNRSISSVMAILFIYAVTIVVYTFKPWNLDSLLSPLPFVTFFNDYLVILPLVGIRPTVLCRELLSLVMLVFLVNLVDTFMPQGKTTLRWFLLRFCTVLAAMGLHIVAHWACNAYLPGFFITYAPSVLLSILVLLLTLGFLNAVLSLVLTITNPIVGVIYTFFFSNVIGKQLTKAVFSTGILCVILYFIEAFGYSFIHISAVALTAYIPLAIICLGLWYLIGRLL